MSGNICLGHASSCAHLRARAVARAYKQRSGDDKRPGGVGASFNPDIPSFDDEGPARAHKSHR